MKVINRELSWLEFNYRVLMEAGDENSPLLERAKFSAIFSSNLDEFFMVRVAAIKNQISSGYDEIDRSGYTAGAKLDAIHERVRTLVTLQHDMTEKLLGQLEAENVRIVRKEYLSKSEREGLEKRFNLEIFPVLTPMAVDYSRRFPLVANKALYLAVKLIIGFESKLAIVQVPTVLPRLVKINKKGAIYDYALLEDVIEMFIDRLFPGTQVVATGLFRVTRNGDLNIVEDEAEDLLMVIEEAVKLRKWGETVRLEISSGTDAWLKEVLKNALKLEEQQVYEVNGIMDLTVLMQLKGPKQLSRQAYKPKYLPFMDKKALYKNIREGDLFVHHPYESFDPVVDFVKQASKDPNVLAIKQTLYRVSGDSQIVKALFDAAERGKQVTVLVELMARFDEENNINWAKKLEQKGVHVIYGILGLKTHSKITLVVRREKNKIRRYLHLGTGNYNDQTAKLYTDMGIFTVNERFGADASVFFNMISGFTNAVQTTALVVAPFMLRQRLYDLIDNEIAQAKAGNKAEIVAKMNALLDNGVIERLYEASRAGVKIKLIVRGICALIPGLSGMSENIEVISIVGEFLEHSRIYYFKNGGMFLASADWMPRNLSRRVELMFPVEDPSIIDRLKATLTLYLKDNVKAWHMQSDGSYFKPELKEGAKRIHAQQILKELEYTGNKTFIEQLKERM